MELVTDKVTSVTGQKRLLAQSAGFSGKRPLPTTNTPRPQKPGRPAIRLPGCNLP